MPHSPALSTFFSKLQSRKLLDTAGGEGAPIELKRMAALTVDVSGFTGLTERFAAEGPAGTERLARIIDDHFARLSEIVASFGGDILHFAGDALFAAWPAGDDTALEIATHRAVAAADTIRRILGAAPATDGVVFEIRSAVGVGDALIFVLSNDVARNVLVCGEVVRQVFAADERGRAGDIIVSEEAAKQLGGNAQVEQLPGGAGRVVWLAPCAEVNDITDGNAVPHLEAMAGSAQRAVLESVADGWPRQPGELRTISGVFVSIDEPNWKRPEVVEDFRTELAGILGSLGTAGGTLYQSVPESRGITLVGVFGLPGTGLGEDATRAVQAALAIIDKGNSAARIGVATGLAYCGVYGGPSRRQFGIIGPTMIRAARLMQSAQPGDVLLDEATRRRLRPSLAVTPQPARTLKGLEGPVPVFRAEPGVSREGTRSYRLARKTVGRDSELVKLRLALDRLVAERIGTTIVVEGHAGCGKSQLATQLAIDAEARGLRVIASAAKQDSTFDPYHAWRPVFAELLGSYWPNADAALVLERLLPYVDDDGTLRDKLPLLNAILPISLAETRDTQAMRDEVRADHTRKLLVSILERACARDPIVLLLEDEHWMDASSRRLLTDVASRLPAVFFVSRRTGEVGGDTPILLEGDESVERIVLDPFDEATTRLLIAQRLGALDVADEVAEFIQRRSSGNPLYAEELALVLREYGMISLQNRAAVATTGSITLRHAYEEAFRSAGLYGTLEGVIMTRLDRLTHDQRFLIRVASVFGQAFSAGGLAAVYRRSGMPVNLRTDLRRLVEAGVVEATDDTESEFVFRHAIIRDVAYSSLSFAQRAELHGMIAERLETRVAPGFSEHDGLLAWHWKHANEPARAFRYFVLAGAAAIRAHATREGIGLLTDARALAVGKGALDGIPEPDRSTRLSRVEMLLGRAYVALSMYDDDRRHFEAGVALLGMPVPTSSARAAFGIIREGVLQLFFRFAERWRHIYACDASCIIRYLDVARAYDGLAETYYFSGDETRTLHAALRSLNLAERAGPSVELARAYGTSGAIVGFIPLRGASYRYGLRALCTARELGDADALTYVDTITGIVRVGQCDWKGARELLTEARDLADRSGDRRRRADARGHLLAIDWFLGDTHRALHSADDLYAQALEDRDIRYQVEALRMRAHILVELGEIDRTVEDLTKIDALLATGLPAIQNLVSKDSASMWALVHARTGADQAALAAARTADRLMSTGSPTDDLYLGFLIPSAVAEASMLLWKRGVADAESLARRACRHLSRHIRPFPIAVARAHLWRGVLYAADGQKRSAQRAWRRAMALADTHGLATESALARSELARSASARDPQRAALRRDAEARLIRLDAPHHLQTLYDSYSRTT